MDLPSRNILALWNLNQTDKTSKQNMDILHLTLRYDNDDDNKTFYTKLLTQQTRIVLANYN